LEDDPSALKEECEEAQRHIDQIIDNVHRLSRDLSPHILEDLGLSEALRWLVSDFAKHHRVEASSDVGDIDSSFSQETQRVIYRIFQEALTNVAKHAQATRVTLDIQEETDSVSFSVTDDGKGFNVKQAMLRDLTEKGMGLSAMEERARMLGGSLEIRSEKGKGTTVGFTIPVDTEES
jgi:signal transduction histidine kinase